MRRVDREITQREDMLAMLEHMPVLRLGLNYEGLAYIVPVNYGYIHEPLTFYVHSSCKGKKIELLRLNPHISFELDGAHRLIQADEACGYSFAYDSIMGQATVQFIEDKVEKIEALNHLMFKHTQKNDWTYADASLDRVCVFKLDVTQWSAKRHLHPDDSPQAKENGI